jgi:hypothetical protein
MLPAYPGTNCGPVLLDRQRCLRVRVRPVAQDPTQLFALVRPPVILHFLRPPLLVSPMEGVTLGLGPQAARALSSSAACWTTTRWQSCAVMSKWPENVQGDVTSGDMCARSGVTLRARFGSSSCDRGATGSARFRA